MCVLLHGPVHTAALVVTPSYSRYDVVTVPVMGKVWSEVWERFVLLNRSRL